MAKRVLHTNVSGPVPTRPPERLAEVAAAGHRLLERKRLTAEHVLDERPDAFDGKNLLVADKACNECLLSRHRIVSEERANQLLRACYEEGRYFICHKATLKGRAVICHNFAKSTNGAGNVSLRVAQHFGLLKYVDPEG